MGINDNGISAITESELNSGSIINQKIIEAIPVAFTDVFPIFIT
jgi:hypothetical protein